MLGLLNDLLWNYALTIVLVAIGLAFTVVSRFVQFRYFGRMFGTLVEASRRTRRGAGAQRLHRHPHHLLVHGLHHPAVGRLQPGSELKGIALTQAALAGVVGEWGRSFVSVALMLFAFTSIIYNHYLGENSLNFFSNENRPLFTIYRVLTLVLVLWG